VWKFILLDGCEGQGRKREVNVWSEPTWLNLPGVAARLFSHVDLGDITRILIEREPGQGSNMTMLN
jgi:hypothetical protein